MNHKRHDYFVYVKNKSRVTKALKEGDIDYGAFSEIGFVDEFFNFLISTDFIPFCQASYPSPRVKEEVAPWFLLASLIGAKMHGEISFRNIPYVLKNGSLLKLLGFNIGPMPGFNSKNKQDRIYPVDQDTIRKFFKDTDPGKLTSWFNTDFSSWMAKKKAYSSGIFIIDASFIPVPDNKNYQNAEYVWLDSSNNHVKSTDPGAKLTLCYKLSTLLNTDREGSYYIYAGARLDPGKVNGLSEGTGLVDGFIKNGGYIDTLLIDRGYLDSEVLAHFKKDYKINWVIPLKTNMDCYLDAVGLSKAKNTVWDPYRLEQDDMGFSTIKEEVTMFFGIKPWGNLSVPIYVSIKKQTSYIDGTVNYFMLAHSKKYKYASQAFELYEKRTKIEERHRQLKGWWNLTSFTSTSFPLVNTQTLFNLLTYSLMQLYLVRSDMASLAKKTISTITKREKMGKCVVILYSGQYYGVFNFDEYSFFLMNLDITSKKRLKKKIKDWNRDPP